MPSMKSTTPAGEPAPRWVSTSMSGLMPGTNLVPFTDDCIYLASSPEAASAFWGHSNPFLAYYRVLPEGEPVAVDSAPGIYRCDGAMITQELGRSETDPRQRRHAA